MLIRRRKWKNSTTGVASDFGNLPTTRNFHVEKKTKKAEFNSACDIFGKSYSLKVFQNPMMSLYLTDPSPRGPHSAAMTDDSIII